jgi:hypothetical protein
MYEHIHFFATKICSKKKNSFCRSELIKSSSEAWAPKIYSAKIQKKKTPPRIKVLFAAAQVYIRTYPHRVLSTTTMVTMQTKPTAGASHPNQNKAT